MKAVFDTKAHSAYDDDICHRYHFPSRYGDIVRECVGDWILFRQPRADGGTMSYFAAARVDRVVPDYASAKHSYAIISDFLAFERPVSWREPTGRYAEEALRDLASVRLVGIYLRGRSIRRLSDADFVSIATQGLAATVNPQAALLAGLERSGLDPETLSLIEDTAPTERRIVCMLLNRKIRDANFRKHVRDAYDRRCAVSGLRMIDGRGRPEVQAAHILPVAEGGPDTVQNGIALSGTIHWMFDRHLISVTDDYRLLVSHNKVPPELRPLIRQQSKTLHLPADRRLWPSPSYLARHRERFAAA